MIGTGAKCSSNTAHYSYHIKLVCDLIASDRDFFLLLTICRQQTIDSLLAVKKTEHVMLKSLSIHSENNERHYGVFTDLWVSFELGVSCYIGAPKLKYTSATILHHTAPTNLQE